MTVAPDISVSFGKLQLSSPVFTASGTCGYADELSEFFDMNCLGGFITKSITLQPRMGNPPPRIVETDAGMLNAIGLANIGLERFIDEKLPILQHLEPAVFVNVAGSTIDEYVSVIERLATQQAVAGFELNISCPNVTHGGIEFGKDPKQVQQITAAAREAAGDKMLMVKLSPAVTDITAIGQAAVEAGADALSLINTFTAMRIDIESRRPVLANRTGGLSGPAIKPIAVYLVHKLYSHLAKPRNIPLLGGGGIRTAADALEFILAGASAVAVGTATFVDPATPMNIVEGIRRYCIRHQIDRLEDLIGAVETNHRQPESHPGLQENMEGEEKNETP